MEGTREFDENIKTFMIDWIDISCSDVEFATFKQILFDSFNQSTPEFTVAYMKMPDIIQGFTNWNLYLGKHRKIYCKREIRVNLSLLLYLLTQEY